MLKIHIKPFIQQEEIIATTNSCQTESACNINIAHMIIASWLPRARCCGTGLFIVKFETVLNSKCWCYCGILAAHSKENNPAGTTTPI